MKKPILLGGSIVLIGALGMASGDNKETSLESRFRGRIETVSGKITHVDEDSFTIWATHAGTSAFFENIRVTESNGDVHKLIYLGPSSYKVGDEVKRLNYKCLENGGIYLGDLKNLLTLRTSCQTGYVEADGIIIDNVPRNITNQLR